MNLTEMYEHVPNRFRLFTKLNSGMFGIEEIIELRNFGEKDIDVHPYILNIKQHLFYEEGYGIQDSEELQELFEILKIQEVLKGTDENYRYMRTNSGDQLFSIKVSYPITLGGCQDLFYDFNTIKEADFSDLIDDEAIDNFFNSSTFLVPEGKEDEDEPSKYLFEDYDLVRRTLCAQPELYSYTLIEEDGEAYIIDGYHFVNRMGYFISDTKIEMPESIRYF